MLCPSRSTLCQVSSISWSKQYLPKKITPVSISPIRKWDSDWMWLSLQLTSVISAFKALTLGLIRTGRAAQQSLLGQALASRALSSSGCCSTHVTGMAAGPHKLCDIWNWVTALPRCCHPPGAIHLCRQNRAGRNHQCRLQRCCCKACPVLFTAHLEWYRKFSWRSRAADHFLDTDKCQKRSAKSFLYKCSISLPEFLRCAAIQTSASFHLQALVIPKMVLPSSSAVQFQHSFMLVLVPVVLWNRDCFAFYERGIYL